MRRLVPSLAVVLVTFVVVTESASACSCAPADKPTLRGFDAAATARLVEVREKGNSGDTATLVYRILRTYKNRNLEEGEELIIRRSPQESACGLPRKEGERYGLRLDRGPRGLTSSLCALLSPRELRRAAERSGNARSGDCSVSA